MIDQERLMIIGGGFIGQSIKTRYPSAVLISNNSPLSSINYPESVEAWGRLLAEYDPLYIIACFGTASVQGVVQQTAMSFYDQISKSLLLFNALVAHKSSCPKILLVGSAAEYGCITERFIEETDEPQELNLYGALKFSIANVSQFYFRQYALPIIYVRQFNTSGPLQRRDFVIPSLVHQYLDQINGRVVDIKAGDLDVCRDFIHIDDTVEAYAYLLEKGKIGEVYNVSSNKGYVIRDILKYLESRYEQKANIKIDENLQRKENIKKNSIIGQNKKLRDLGWAPKKTVEDIIDEVIEAYQ